MVPRVLLVCLAVLPMSACNLATSQDIQELAASIKALDERTAANADEIKSLQNGATELAGATEPSPEADSQPEAEPGSQPEAEPVAQLEERLEKLEDDVVVLTNLQQNNETQLGQIAARDQNGEYYLRLDSKSEVGRTEVRRAIQSAAPPVGYLHVYNRMGSDQFIYVDGDWFRVKPDMPRAIPVRRGTVTTALPGQQQAFWNISSPDYQIALDIRPTQGTPIPR